MGRMHMLILAMVFFLSWYEILPPQPGRHTYFLKGSVRKIQQPLPCEVGSIPNWKALGSMSSR